jgi:hypothetical protein
MNLLLQMHDMAFKLIAFPRPTLRSGRVVSPAAALARARANYNAAFAAERAGLFNGVRGARLLRLARTLDRAERALRRAQRVVDKAARRP